MGAMMIRISRYSRLALVALSLAPFSALAQPGSGAAPSDDQGLGDIVVTAEKREQSLQAIPASITAFGPRQLETKGITGIADLLASVPNVQLTPFPNVATSQRIFIRGIGNVNDQITQDPSVAVYVDGIYSARIQGQATDVAELERVEVLRGPQGSLYGRNATGGAINFITKAPEFGKFSASQRLSTGNYDLFEARTFVNVPLGDHLAAQLSYYHSQRDGFVQNLGTGAERFGDRRRDAYRAAVRWAPVEGLDIRYAYDRSDVGDTAPYALVPVGFYPIKARRPTQSSPFVRDLQRNDITAQGHSLTISYDVADGVQLKSLTGYRKLDTQYNQNNAPGIFGPFPANRSQFFQKQDQFSQEFQVVGEAADQQLQYIAGLFYFQESASNYDTSRQYNFNAAKPGLNYFERRVTAHNKAYAAYAQATYSPEAFDRRLHLTLGGRYSYDTREGSFQRNVTPATGPQVVGPFGEGRRTSRDFSPSATIAFDVTPRANIYAKVVSGYKTGGFNVNASALAKFIAGFGPEDVLSYEAGIKSEWLDRRLRFNLAAFHMNYKNIQVGVPDAANPTLVDIINAGKARIDGFELDITAQPTRGLTFTANYGYLDARFTQVINSAGVNIAPSFPFVQAPKHTLTTAIDYRFPETAIGTLSANLSYSFVDKQFSQPGDARYIIPDYGLLDARLTLADIPVRSLDAKLSVWGKNLTDKDYYITHANFFAPGAQFGTPRTYGLDLTIAL
jgi:iron complex outermembrane receptor protein